MKFGRRAFLQIAAGAVGGTLLSPLPWKLADDTAIWTQNWSWRPSPARGRITKAATTCLLCGGGCGIQVHLVSDNRGIYVQGNPDHPVNEGGVCPLGAAGMQFLYAPYRVRQPLKQFGQRGDAKGFKPISWKEAMLEVGQTLQKLRSSGKAHMLAGIGGQPQSSMTGLWRRFFAAFGSRNFFQTPSHNDSLQLAGLLTMGKQATPAFALEKASYVLSFGANLIEGWGAPCRMQALFGRWQQKTPGTKAAKIVQIEPRCSMTAAKADRWIPVNPGTEAALALGIAHVMIRQQLYDSDFMRNHVFGFEDWTDRDGKPRQGFKAYVLANYSPQQVAAWTGVDATRIKQLAREFASLMNAVAVWGDTGAGLADNIYHDLSFLALNALKGNLRPGRLVSLVPPVPFGSLPQPDTDETARNALQHPRLDLAHAQTTPLTGNNLYGFLDALAHKPAYPIEVLLLHEANPLYTLAETEVSAAALKKVAKIISFSSYMDETAMQSDLILPNHTAFERYEDVIGLPTVPYGYYAVAKPILPPQLDTRHTGDVLLELSRKLGGTVADAFPWKDYQSYLRQRVKELAASQRGAVAEAGMKAPWKLQVGQSPQRNYKDAKDLWNKLTAGQCWYDAPANPLHNLSTQSGKYQLACESLQQRGVTGKQDKLYLPHFAPLAASGNQLDYPLLLVSYRTFCLTSGYLANPPFMTKNLFDFVLTHDDLFVELNPKTARSLGLKEGNRAVLKTPKGEVPVRVRVFAGAHPGTIFIVEGLGHTAYDEYISHKGVNANHVIEVQMDPVTGLGTVWATRAQLQRA